MARPESDPPRELDPLKGGLKHNPLAALRAKAEAAGVPIVERAQAAEGAREQSSSAPPGAALVRERVTLRFERSGRGGKAVTLAEGPGLAGRKLADLAKDAARALGVGARVEDGALLVQGDQRERLASWLATRGFTNVQLGN